MPIWSSLDAGTASDVDDALEFIAKKIRPDATVQWLRFPKSLLFQSVTPQRQVTGNMTLTPDHAGAVVFVASDTPVTLTAADSLPDGFECVIVQAGKGRVRVDGNLLAENDHNVVNSKGGGVSLSKITGGAAGASFWLAGALTDHLQDLQDASGKAIATASGTIETH